MFLITTRKVFRSNSLLVHILAGCGFGLVLGLVGLRLSLLLVLGIVVAGFCLDAFLKKPEIALVGIIIATSSIVFEDQLPMIDVGISLHIPDLLLLGALGLIGVRWMVERDFKIVRTPLDWPLIAFLSITLISTVIALLESSVEVESARRWIRILSYYLTLFVVTNLVREPRQLIFLLKAFFMLATIVAMTMVAQFLVGDSVQLLPGRVESLNTQGTMFEDITRILPPGWSIVLVSFVAIFCILVLRGFELSGSLIFFQCCVMGLALLVTFLRSYWSVILMAIVLLAYLFRGMDRLRLIGWGFLVAYLTGIILMVVFSDPGSRAARLVGASIDRLSTLGRAGTFQGEDDSVNWRKIENQYALNTVAMNPWIGLGMGFTYRPWDRRLDGSPLTISDYDFRKHIHNGHLWILLQSGVLGYLSFIWLSVTFLVQGFKHWRYVTDDYLRGVMLGFTVIYLGIVIAALVNSTFMQWRWTPVLGMIMGVNEVIRMRYSQKKTVE